MPRKPNYGPGKLKKVAKVAGAPKVSQFKMRIGTPNELGEAVGYSTESKLRQTVGNLLKGYWTHWCERYNNAGLEAIGVALDRLGQMTITMEHKRLEVVTDERYGIVVVFEFWKEW